jgi:hypothetical protein
VVFEWFGGAGEEAGGPDPEDVGGLEGPFAGDALQGLGLDAEFLAELADEGLLGGLAGFELAAGELPAAGEFGWGAAAGGEEAAFVEEGGADHDDDGFGHARHSMSRAGLFAR